MFLSCENCLWQIYAVWYMGKANLLQMKISHKITSVRVVACGIIIDLSGYTGRKVLLVTCFGAS